MLAEATVATWRQHPVRQAAAVLTHIQVGFNLKVLKPLLYERDQGACCYPVGVDVCSVDLTLVRKRECCMVEACNSVAGSSKVVSGAVHNTRVSLQAAATLT